MKLFTWTKEVLSHTFLSFGSIFMMIGANTGSPVYTLPMGAIMLSLGLIALYHKVSTLERTVAELTKSK